MIAILMATYNGESFIKEQIESILSQTCTDWHLWIEDDGSTDSTVSLIKAYAEKYSDKINMLNAQKNRLGSTKRFENILKSVQAEYYMFADQDDVWLPKKIEKAFSQMKKAESDKQIPIIICTDLQVVDEQLKQMSSSYKTYTRLRPDLLQSTTALAINNYITGCTMLFNQAAKSVSLPFGKDALYHDAWIALRTSACGGKIIYSEDAQILYRQHKNNKVGAVENVKSFSYLLRKLLEMPRVLKAQHFNYKQAHEAIGISRIKFIHERIKYLIKR